MTAFTYYKSPFFYFRAVVDLTSTTCAVEYWSPSGKRWVSLGVSTISDLEPYQINYDELPAEMADMRHEEKLSVYRITKRSEDGSILETEFIRNEWVPMWPRRWPNSHHPSLDIDEIYVVPSQPEFRSVKV